MRRGEVVFRFTSLSNALSASRIGTDQLFAQQIDAFNPPIAVSDSTHQFSYRRTRKATTTHGNYFKGSVRLPCVSGDRLILLTELLESIKNAEPYTINANNIPGVMREYEVFTPTKSIEIPRRLNQDLYAQIVIPFQTLGDASPVTTNAVQLSLGVLASDALGNFGAAQRFAYYYFTGAETNRTFACTLSGNDLKVTVNGHPLIVHDGTSQTYAVLIASTKQSSGTNIIRVEALSPESAWSVSDALIT